MCKHLLSLCKYIAAYNVKYDFKQKQNVCECNEISIKSKVTTLYNLVHQKQFLRGLLYLMFKKSHGVHLNSGNSLWCLLPALLVPSYALLDRIK